jgi:hypothetical protein
MEKGRCQESGTRQPNMRTIRMDLSHANDQFSSLFYIFTEMWLMYHCRSPWFLEQNHKARVVTVSFSDPKEATHFKLSKQFGFHCATKDSISSFITDGRAYV